MTGEFWLGDLRVAQLLWMADNKILISHVEEEGATFERLGLGASSQCLEGTVPCSARQRRRGELLDPPRDPAISAKINCKGPTAKFSLGRAHGGSKISTDMGTRPTRRAECSRDRLRGSMSRHRHASASRCLVSAASGRSAATGRGVVQQDLHRANGTVQRWRPGHSYHELRLC
jgi:hypothetical protein